MVKAGVDLGGTTIKIGLLDEEGSLTKRVIPTESGSGYERIFERISECILSMLEEGGIGLWELGHVGMASPGILSEDGEVILFAANLGFTGVRAAEELKKYFSCPVSLKNDADAAALGEHVYGAGKEYRSTVTITIGTGVGAGIVIDNQIMAGSFHSGGEIGHHIIVSGGRPCTCGQRGCMEQYCSASALVADAKEKSSCYPDSKLAKLYSRGTVNAQDIFEAAAEGDWPAVAAVDGFVRSLGIGVINVINILQPQAVIIGGGVSEAGRALTEPLEAYVKTHILFGEKNFRTHIRCARLGNDAGMIGAALL